MPPAHTLTRSLCLLFLQGHAAPVLYAAWAEAGVIPMDELKNLRKIDSELEGHPTPVSVTDRQTDQLLLDM